MTILPNILIVDDNSTNLMYLEIILRNIQAKMIWATSGPEALELTQDLELSLAILDVQMPVMNGYELAVKINENRSENKVPIIFLTADYPNNSKILEGYKAGAVDYLIKPLNELILISKIKVFLELSWQKQRVVENTEKLIASELELKNAKNQLEQMNEYLIKAVEEERSSISLQVHDELGQAMTALKMDLNWVKQNLDNSELASLKMERMISTTNEVIRRVQRISSELHPGVLDDLGLVSAIEWYCEEFFDRTGVPCFLSLEEIEPVSSKLNLALFRVVQESLTNVIRHSQASEVSIDLSSENEVVMMIRDNGIGIPDEVVESGKSFGIMGMRQRIQQCGGSIEFISQKGEGTTVIVKVPKSEIQ
jgi:signal transduction histidine kinase